MSPRLALVPVLLALAFAGCRSAGACCPRRGGMAPETGGPTVLAAPLSIAVPSSPGPSAPTQSGTIVDHRDGSTVSFDAMIDRLSTASAVYVGELHDQAHHHAFQAKVLEALYAKWRGKRVALGLEMFYRPFQPALDAYVKGEIDEKEMLEKTDWDNRWHNYWEAYAPMIRFCREHRITVLALNAPAEVTRTANKKGLAALSPEQKAMLPALDLDNAAHRAHFKEALGSHGGQMAPAMFEGMYRAYLIWDSVMGATAASFLARNGPDAHVVVVAGDAHVGDRVGIPAHVQKYVGRSYLSVVQYVVPGANPHARGQGAAGAGEAPTSEAHEADERLSLEHADYSAWWTPSGLPATPRKAPRPGPAQPSGDAPTP